MESDPRPILLILDLPASAFCGIDLISFTSSPKFQGFKGVPHGWHFVYTGATSVLSIRSGTWIYFEDKTGKNKNENDTTSSTAKASLQRQVLIRGWDAAREVLVNETDGAEAERLRDSVAGLWRENLSPYTQNVMSGKANGSKGSADSGDVVEDRDDWAKLTDCLSAPLLRRILGVGSADRADFTLSSASCAAADKEEIPGIRAEDFEQQVLGFLPIDLRESWRPGAIGRERTLAAQDRSYLLRHIIEEHSLSQEGSEIVGELQFCFIMILTLNNFSCMEQWNRIFQMLLSCKTAVPRMPELFVSLMENLRLQLKHCDDADGGLFDLSDEGGALLKNALRGFKRGLAELAEKDQPTDVLDALEDLEHFVKAAYGWVLDESFVRSGVLELEDGEQVQMDVNDLEEEDETGEYAPVIVDLADTIPSDQSKTNVA